MASSLTGAELKAYKRQQRMIRNRESASLSRQRRKAHLEQIELRNKQLEKENKSLQQQVRQLQAQLSGYQTVYVEVPLSWKSVFKLLWATFTIRVNLLEQKKKEEKLVN